MRILASNRGEGKTYELIKRSHAEWKYIVCSTKQRVEHIAKMAADFKIDIPYPISAKELPITSKHIKGVLVDDFEDMLQYMIGKPVEIATTSCEIINMKDYKQQFSITSPYNFTPPRVLKEMLTSDEYIQFIKDFVSRIRIENDNIILENKSVALMANLGEWVNMIAKAHVYSGNPEDIQIGSAYAGYLNIANITYLIIPYNEVKDDVIDQKIQVLRKVSY